jgi:hypothetical protein
MTVSWSYWVNLTFILNNRVSSQGYRLKTSTLGILHIPNILPFPSQGHIVSQYPFWDIVSRSQRSKDILEKYIVSIVSTFEEKSKQDNNTLHACVLLGLFIDPEDGDKVFLRNVS